MEHAKKFVLVDPRMYRPTMPDKRLSGLDQEIQSTLNSDMSDDQKVKIYLSTLAKYRAYEHNTKVPEVKNVVETELADSLPPNQQYKAKKLLRLIKDNPEIEWSDRGELIYKQTLYPKSHISDLAGDALAPKKPVRGSIAWEEFDDALDSSNVPTTLAPRRPRRNRVKKIDWQKFDEEEESKSAKKRGRKQKWIKT
jgi:hypothetical protein